MARENLKGWVQVVVLCLCGCLGPLGAEEGRAPGAERSDALLLTGGAPVSGVATLSRGNGLGQPQTFALELAGSDLYFTWPALGYGDWKLSVVLADAAGTAVYQAARRFLVSPVVPRPDAVTLTDDAGVSLRVIDRRSALLFWNTLDGEAAVAASRVGVGGRVEGSVHFAPVKFGSGVGDFADPMSYVAFDDLFGASERSRFAVEAWVDWGNLSRSNMSPFTVQGEPFGWGESNFNLGAAQSTGAPGRMLRDLAVVLQWRVDRYLVYIWRAEVPAVSYLEHLAASVDLAGPAARKVRLFRDGVEQGPPNWASVEVDPQPSIQLPPYARIGQSVPGNPWVLGCFVDNLKVWSYAKADYSDRFVE